MGERPNDYSTIILLLYGHHRLPLLAAQVYVGSPFLVVRMPMDLSVRTVWHSSSRR